MVVSLKKLFHSSNRDLKTSKVNHKKVLKMFQEFIIIQNLSWEHISKHLKGNANSKFAYFMFNYNLVF